MAIWKPLVIRARVSLVEYGGRRRWEGVVRRWRKLGKTTLPKSLVEKEGRKKTMYL